MFADSKFYISFWIFMYMTMDVQILDIVCTGVNGSLLENMAFHSVHGALHPEIAIVMDMGGNTKLGGMDQHTENTVKRWIKYSMPEGEAIGVAQIGTFNKILLPMTIMEDLNQRSSLASKIKPVVHGESNSLKGIHIAEKMISKNGGFIFILSHKKWEEVFIGTNEKKTLSCVLERDLTIVNIFIRMNTYSKINELNSHVQFLNVSENSLHVKHEMRLMHIDSAIEEIMAVYPSDWGHNDISTSVIFEKEIKINQQSNVSVGVSITVFSCNQFRRLEISAQMLYGSSMCKLSHNLPKCNETQNGIDIELNTLWISYSCSLNGTWTLSLLCPSSNNETSIYKTLLKVLEVCEFEKEKNGKPIQFSCIACEDRKNHAHIGNELNLEKGLCVRGDDQKYKNDIYSQPVKIFSQIEDGDNLLENINITVAAEEVSSQINPNGSNKEIIELHDGGWGVDKFSKDHIYSGYFSPPGNSYNHCLKNSSLCRFSLVCSASGYQPGYGEFQIQVRGPPFHFQKTDESYPPDKIRDLNGEQEAASSNINLIWTAAGISLGKGNVTEYALKFMDNCDENSSIANGQKENESAKNRKNEIIYFHQPSTPGEISKYSVSLEDNKRNTRELSDNKICFVLEAIGDSHKKTMSNCACALLNITVDSLDKSHLVLILLAMVVPAVLSIMCIWKWKRILRGCFGFFRRNKRRNASEKCLHYDGQTVKVLDPEARPLH